MPTWEYPINESHWDEHGILLGELALTNAPHPAGLVDPPLPHGYHYADPDTITTAELADIKNLHRQSLHNYHTAMPWDIEKDLRYERNRGAEIYIVGVRGPDGELVGSGVLQAESGEGFMGDFFVKEPHRHKGIGRAIIDRRLQIADAIGAKSCGLFFEETNTLISYYEQLGFEQYRETEEGVDVYFRVRPTHSDR